MLGKNAMIDFRNYKGFALMRGDSSSEATLLYLSPKKLPIVRVGKKEKVPPGYAPSGSVDWCEFQLGKTIVPDYYPDWLSEHFGRKIWREEHWPLGKKVFIKPADRHKRFTGFVTGGTYRKKKRGPYWCSEVVHFVNEWRYYVADGEVISSGWYSGDEANTPDAPELNAEIPEGFCGALDFGMTTDNRFLLVENNQAYACGWYNKDAEAYANWLVAGWDYTKKLAEKQQ